MEALHYFNRVYALKPDDPLLNLIMGLAYLGAAFKRLSPNRQYEIMQGLSLVARYQEIRSSSEHLIEKQEAEFNMGRTYQTLGLNHLCIPYYERCLEMGRTLREQGEMENFGVEAAFALKHIWSVNGQVERAEIIMEEWLVM